MKTSQYHPVLLANVISALPYGATQPLEIEVSTQTELSCPAFQKMDKLRFASIADYVEVLTKPTVEDESPTKSAMADAYDRALRCA